MKNKFFPLQLLVVCCFSFTAIANSDSDPYFEANTINPRLIDPPLELESKERQEEIKQIIELQNNITAKEIELATGEYSIVPESMISPIIPDLKRKQYVGFYKLLDRVEETALNVKDSIKDYWKVERPYQVSKEIKSLIKVSTNSCYPSGHAAKLYAMAYIAGLLIPEKREEFVAFAEAVSLRRIAVGEHFPSDIKAGRRLSLIVIGGLMQNKEFLHDFEEAKKELHKYYYMNS